MLSFSKWRWVGLAYSETFEALVRGLQDALWALGGVPRVWRSDNLSAATHQIMGGGRELNRRFAAVLDHYGSESTRIEPGKSHQNGGAEKAHDVLKSALDQAMVIRGSRDFATVAKYEELVQTVRDRIVADKQATLLAEERQHLRPLPPSRVPAYTTYKATVRQWSTIHFAHRVYSVPSRLIGCEVEVRQHPDLIEVFYRDKPTATMPRIRGDRYHQIDYRHVIWSLVRKPGAFARYRYREELFPALVFRRAYDALVDARGERADVEYVRILHLAASTMQADVEHALEILLGAGERPDFASVKALAAWSWPASVKRRTTSAATVGNLNLVSSSAMRAAISVENAVTLHRLPAAGRRPRDQAAVSAPAAPRASPAQRYPSCSRSSKPRPTSAASARPNRASAKGSTP